MSTACCNGKYFRCGLPDCVPFICFSAIELDAKSCHRSSVLSVILNTLEGGAVCWVGSRMCTRVARTFGKPAVKIAPLLTIIRLMRPVSVKVGRASGADHVHEGVAQE